MKKLLLLAGILVVGATSFAEGVQGKQYVQQDGEVYSTTLKVSAEVVQDLTLTTKEVKFGRVATGMKDLQPETKGEIEITGLAGASVKVGLYEIDSETPIGDGGTTLLTMNGETVLNYYPNFSEMTVKLESQGGNSGNKKIVVDGTLDVPVGASAGYYSRNLLVKAKYTSFSDK